MIIFSDQFSPKLLQNTFLKAFFFFYNHGANRAAGYSAHKQWLRTLTHSDSNDWPKPALSYRTDTYTCGESPQHVLYLFPGAWLLGTERRNRRKTVPGKPRHSVCHGPLIHAASGLTGPGQVPFASLDLKSSMLHSTAGTLHYFSLLLN